MSKKPVTLAPDTKQHYKMYKVGKRWLFASISVITFGAILVTSSADFKDAAAQSVPATQVADKNKINTTDATVYSDNSIDKLNIESAANNGVKSTELAAVNPKSAAAVTEVQSSENESTPAAATTPATDASSSSDTDLTSADSDSSEAATSASSDSSAAATSSSTATKQSKATTADAKATSAVSFSEPKIGYQTDTKGMTIAYTFTGVANDEFSITIPKSSGAYTLDDIPAMTTGMGTMTSVVNADGSTTVTYKLSVASSYTAKLHLTPVSNGYNQSTATTENGTTTKTITTTINGVAQTPATFTQVINPTAKPTAPVRTAPAADQITAIAPNIDYVYQIKVNEANGVQDDSGATSQVNPAANYGGTTIKIPVPSTFVLNQDLSAQLSGTTGDSGTTITQPDGIGGDIVITVAPGKGSYSAGGYQIAGHYEMAQATAAQTVAATGNVTISQILNDKGDTLTASSPSNWTDQIVGTGETGKKQVSANLIANGNSSTTSDKLLLDTNTANDPKYLDSFEFNTYSVANLKDAAFTVTIPDGLNATSIKVSDGGTTQTTYLAGTSQYDYTITLADGTKETGTVAAGGTITPKGDSAIRQAVLTPNVLVAGAATGTPENQRIVVYGNVAQTYDDGTAVKSGDKLTSKISLSAPNTTVKLLSA